MRCTITVDIASLPRSGDSYRYVPVTVDLFSICAELVFLKDQSAKSVCRAVRAEWIHRHGLLIRTITD